MENSRLVQKIICLIVFFSYLNIYSQATQTVDFIATKDAYIRGKSGGDQNKSFGNCNDLRVKGKVNDLKRSLIQFNISSIPSNAYIESAELRLNSLDDKNMTVSVFEIGSTNSWDESSSCGGTSSANWKTRQGSSNWTAPGVVGNNYNDGTPIATINAAYKGIQSWFITSLVQDWVSGIKTNNGVMLGCNDGSDEESKYESIDEGDPNPPTLRITYRTVFDNDNDGVYNQIDIDDDNDGILDTDECSSLTNPPLLNANFEALDILTLDGGPTDVVGTDGIWKGDASNIPNWLSADATNNYLEIWHNSQRAGNDSGGQAYSGSHWAEVNATTNDGLYQDVVSTPGTVLQWTFAHRKRTGYSGSANEDVLQLLIGDPGGTLISQGTFTSAGDSSWTLHTGQYIVPAGQTTTRLTFTVLGTASGSTSSGNFIDQVQLYAIPSSCEDTDNDSIPDYLDLDSDNDGIPDIVEAGHASASSGTATIPLGSFTDANGNGMHDAFENTSPLDSDNDGVPNYKDLDSDNDTVFDVDEARTARYVFGNLVFDNGDGDNNGDGVGDGVDTEAFREKDDDNDGNLEYFGDGILDIYDYGTGANEYGNLSQGSAPHYVADTDDDGIPDYIDTTSDGSTFDISHTHYADLDANNDGVIDDTNDSDDDGIVDLFDTNDSGFGSPRDLQKKLELFFDGRNDYVESDFNFSGLTETTVMAWIKLDPSFSKTARIFDQGSIAMEINGTPKLSAKVNSGSTNVSNSPILSLNTWYHIALIFDSSLESDNLKMYVNGELIDSAKHSSLTSGINSNSNKFIIGSNFDADNMFFNGVIDEFRVFDVALTESQLHQMMHQEIDDNGSKPKGAIIPVDIENLSWSNLKRYYRMDAFKDNVLDDLTSPTIDEGSGARMYNTKIIEEQTAPLPYITNQSGRLDVAVNDPTRGISGSDAILNKGAIVKIQHSDVYIDSSLNQVGLIIDEQDAASNPIEFKVLNDSELNVSWYLKLDGKIDLEGESQLVQGTDSYLDPTSSGTLEKDQQGTADTYTYNYWSMPVGVSNNSTNNNSYTVKDVFDVNFLSSGYNGTASPVGIADYWIWKFNNKPSGNYSQWQHVRSTGTLKPGEGFTMKGPGTGSISTPQNYVLEGKPNNGDINLPINAGNGYLVGNPYASAIDAHKFILDNAATISGTGATTGTIYFWEHWGGGSHNLKEYQGGYATYTLAGGIPAASFGTNDPDVATGGTPTKTPGRYIPVGQGFFISAETDGVVNFNNSQRVFQVEDNVNSVFTKYALTKNNKPTENEVENKDTRLKVRIGFNSVNSIRRQLLATLDENGSTDYDWGYDAPYNDNQMDDMYWMINTEKYTIQATNEINEQTILPLGLHTQKTGVNSIALDKIENAPANFNVYLHDKALNVYHNLNEGAYELHLQAGEYFDRFEITFSNQQALGIDDNEYSNLQVYLSNDKESVVIINPNLKLIESTKLFNVLGQMVFESSMVTNNKYIELPAQQIKTGAYIIRLKTKDTTISKTVLVQ